MIWIKNNTMENTMTNNIKKVKEDLIVELDKRIVDKIIEKTNADLLKKLITSAETINEAIMMSFAQQLLKV